MMRWMGCALAGAITLAVLANCGAPREAVQLAADEVALGSSGPADDASVRSRLIQQDAAWSELAALVQEQQVGGVFVDEEFRELVKEVAALAKRQRELIEAGQDDAALDRQALERFEKMWSDAQRYLAK